MPQRFGRAKATTPPFFKSSDAFLKSFSTFYPSDYPEPEALVLLHREGFTIIEISVNMSSRKGGNSSITLWDSFYYMVKVMLAILIDLCKTIPYKRNK